MPRVLSCSAARPRVAIVSDAINSGSVEGLLVVRGGTFSALPEAVEYATHLLSSATASESMGTLEVLRNSSELVGDAEGWDDEREATVLVAERTAPVSGRATAGIAGAEKAAISAGIAGAEKVAISADERSMNHQLPSQCRTMMSLLVMVSLFAPEV